MCFSVNSCNLPMRTLLLPPTLSTNCSVSVQTLLASIGLCQPQPKVPSELIRFLGKTYCAWHNATWMLEQHVMIFPQDPRCFDALVCRVTHLHNAKAHASDHEPQSNAVICQLCAATAAYGG